MTHDEWMGVIIQAVTATNQGDLREVRRLAFLLEKGEQAGIAMASGMAEDTGAPRMLEQSPSLAVDDTDQEEERR